MTTPAVTTTSESRTAVLLDGHPLWLEAVDAFLGRVDVRVVAKTTSPETALTLVEEHAPDVLITEIRFGSADGAEAIRKALARRPALKCIVLSESEEARDVDAAFAAGAAAYVVKTAHPDDLASAVRQAFRHSLYLAGAPVAAPAPAVVRSDEQDLLTRREREILQLVSEGHSNSQLARMLWVTEQTVKFHLSNTYRKLGVANRTEASHYAHLNNLVSAAEAVAC